MPGQPVRVVKGIRRLGLPGHLHRLATARVVVSIVDGALRRPFLRQVVETVVTAVDRAGNRVGQLGCAVAQISLQATYGGLFQNSGFPALSEFLVATAWH